MPSALVLSEHDPSDWRRGFVAGERAAAAPYGIDVLSESVDLSFIGPRPAAPGPLAGPRTKLRRVLEHRAGFPVEPAVRAARRVRSADLVIALLERQGAAAALARSRGLPGYRGTPLVIFGCWLADDLSRADRAGRAALFERFRGADLITTLSRRERPTLLEAGFRDEQVFAVTYGVSQDYFRPDPAVVKDIPVLSVGQDRGRDYATLLRAAAGIAAPITVVSPAANLAGLTVPERVQVLDPVPLHQYRALLRRAQVVVVPTTDRAYPTGSSVALEAAACGAALVVSDTAAMRELLDDGVTALLTPVGDAAACAAAVDRLLGDDALRARLGSAARLSVETRHNAGAMWRGVWDAVVQRAIVPPEALTGR